MWRSLQASKGWESPRISHGSAHDLHDPLCKYGQWDTHTDPSCCRATDPDVVIGSSLGLDVTMATGGSTGLSELNDPSSSMVPRLQPDPMWWFRLRTVSAPKR